MKYILISLFCISIGINGFSQFKSDIFKNADELNQVFQDSLKNSLLKRGINHDEHGVFSIMFTVNKKGYIDNINGDRASATSEGSQLMVKVFQSLPVTLKFQSNTQKRQIFILPVIYSYYITEYDKKDVDLKSILDKLPVVKNLDSIPVDNAPIYFEMRKNQVDNLFNFGKSLMFKKVISLPSFIFPGEPKIYVCF